MMNTMKTRSRPVTQNRFLRRLMLHFDYLQDETSWMHQASTVIFLLVSLYVQTLPTNTRTDSCLNALLGNSKWVPAILVLGLVTPLVVICLLATSLFVENSLIDNHNNLETPTHLKSHWFVIYKHLYRFNFLLLEPIITGYMVSLILTVSKADEYGIGYTICAIIGGTLGFILNLAYLFFVESILPSQSLTCSTNRHNVALTTLSLRMCLALDRYFTYLDSQTIRAVVMCIRLIPSTVALYFNLFTTFFFLRHAKLFFSGYQISNIIYSITFFIEGGTSYGITIIPASLFIVLALRAVYNIDLLDKSSLRNLSARRLIDVITLCNHLVYKRLGVEELASMRGLRLQAVMAHTADSRFVQYEEFVERFASAEERIEDSEKNTHLFVTYLFERLWHDTGEKNFKVLIYETSWTLFMRPNLFHISLLLARLSAMEMSTIEQSTYRALLRRLEATCKEIYLDKQSLLPVKEQFYAPKSVAEINEAVAFKQKASINDDDSRDGAENTKQQGTTGKPDLLHFDVYSSMQTIEQYERLVGKMQEVISTILKFYDKLKNRVVEIASAHETMKTIKQLKESVTKSFRDLDRLSGEQNLFHLLPYALFLETINNDRQASQKILKVFEHRSQTFERNLMMLRDKSSYTKFNLDLMLCIGVDCTKNSLGRMNYVSSNCEEVFGVQPKSYEGRNVNCLMSDDFQTIHDEFMDKFVRDQNKPYLGVSRERHVRIREQVYTKCDVLVKLAPVLNPTSMSFMCLLKRHTSDEEFIVLNHQGVIVGRSQGLDWADQYRRKSFEVLSPSLPSATIERIQNVLSRNTAAIRRAFYTTGMGTESVNIISPQIKMNENPSEVIESKGSVDPDEGFESEASVYLEKLASEKGVRLKPQRYSYGSKMVFNELLIWFPNRVKSPAEVDTKQIATFIGSMMTPLLNSGLRVTGGGGGGIESSQIASGVSHQELTVQKTSIKIGGKSSFIKRRTAKEASSSKSNKDYFSKPLHSTKLVDAKFAEEFPIQVDPEAQSSIEGSTKSGTKYTAQVKAKVLAAMKHQRKHMAWKEILAIALVEVLIWCACFYTLLLIDDNFNSELANRIELRRGIGMMFRSNSACFNAGVTMIERMLVLRGLIPVNKFEHILPHAHRDLEVHHKVNVEEIRYWSLRLTEFIYKFPFKYGKMYLETTYNYTYTYSEDTNSTMTKQLNQLDHNREAVHVLDRWDTYFVQEGTDLTFDSGFVSLYYELMSNAWEVVGAATVSYLLVTDSDRYKTVVKQVELITIVAIILCALLANVILAVFWRFRRKSINVYSLIECMRSYEISLMQDRVGDTSKIIKENRMSESRLVEKVRAEVNKFDNKYQIYRMESKTSRLYLRKSIGNFSWFGLGKLASILYFIILFYQVLNLLIMDRLSSKLDKLLELQWTHRCLLSSTSVLSALHFNAYYMALSASGYGSRELPEFGQFVKKLESYGNIFDTLLGQLDRFVVTVPMNPTESANFGDFLYKKPCDYLNYSRYGLSLAECEAFGEHSFSKSVLEAHRWLRLGIPGLLSLLVKLNETADPISILNDDAFLSFEFTKRNFNVDFVQEFTDEFFNSLYKYHQDNFVTPVRLLLMVLMVVSASASLLVFCYAVKAIVDNIDADLQVFLLVPPESYYHNPHIAAKLLTITR